MHDYCQGECGAKLNREFHRAPTQTLNFLDCRQKTANVPRQNLPIQLISDIEELHGRN